MLALYIGFAVGLAQPTWAMTTAYIVSQPLSGAVRSKALYRLLGTLLGGAAAIVLVPALIDAPVLLSLAVALWVGLCLGISLLDRTPRSYLMMLAGYTLAIIAFPSVNHPEAVFDTAVARVVEIGLGILCATAIHSIVFPRPVGEALRRRLVVWLADADRGARDILRASGAAVVRSDRRHLSADASEIQILSVHLPFDTSRLRETTAAVQAVHARMLMLIPLLSGVEDRMQALASVSDAQARGAIDDVVAWIERGCEVDEQAGLIRRIETLAAQRRAGDWTGLLVESLLIRLADLVKELGDAHAIARHIVQPDQPLSAAMEAVVAQAQRRPMHADVPLAVLSGAAAAIAILLTCAIWIGTGWADGAGAAAMAAVFCCFFAALDDPVPAIISFGKWFLLAIPLAALYSFAVLPAIDGFPMLVLVLAPPLVFSGCFAPSPRYASAAAALIVGFCNALALQASYSADLAAFLNANLGQFVGLFSAIVVTAAIRSMGIDASVRRLQAQTRRRLAQIAAARAAPTPEDFAAALVDRLGLLTPKLAALGAGHEQAESALRDLRVGMNLVAIQQLRPTLSGTALDRIEALMQRVGEYYRPHRRNADLDVDKPVLAAIDRALDALAGLQQAVTVRGITNLVGLRRNLFPRATDYVPGPVIGQSA